MMWNFSTPELIGFGTQVALLASFWARMEFTNRQRDKDIRLLKQALGYENGHGAPSFVRTETCSLLHHAKDNEIHDIKERIGNLERIAQQP